MADKAKDVDADADDEGSAEPAKKKLSLKFVLMGAAAVLMLGGGAGGYFLFWSKKDAAHALPIAKPAIFLDLPEVLVNLASGVNDRQQYLKVRIVLELPEQSMAEQIKPLMPRVMDAFQVYLRELRPSDLEGSAGLYRLKEELTRRVNVAIAPSRITAVLFKEIVIQ